MPIGWVYPKVTHTQYSSFQAKITEVTAWYSQLGFDGKNDTFMQKVDIKVRNIKIVVYLLGKQIQCWYNIQLQISNQE